jgi:outer membrane protein assembly factor BamB
MAYARGRLYVPVVELCSRESAVTTPDAFARSPAEGTGTLYALDAATGKTVWHRGLASPPFGCATLARDAVVVPTYDGRLSIFDARTGRTVWRTRLTAGNNSCPAVGEDVLVVGAGAPYPGMQHPAAAVVAFAVRR